MIGKGLKNIIKKKTKNFQPIFPIITQPVRKQKLSE